MPDITRRATLDETAPKESGTGLVAFPIPVSNPTIGTGLGVAAAVLYQMDQESQPSFTGMEVLYTNTESWAAGIMQSLSLQGDRYRLSLPIGYARINYDFFGVGVDSGDAGIGVPITQQGYLIKPQAQARVADDLYLGANYRLISVRSSLRNASSEASRSALIADEPQVRSAGVGVILTSDTRDDKFYPTQGHFAEGEATFAESIFLSEKDYRRVNVSFTEYLPVAVRSVIALRGTGCAVSDDSPLFDLCLFGSGADLRGYEGGRYRDRTMLSGQTEYRWRSTGRLGFVGFAGAGSVAPGFGDYTFDDLLYSAGVGVRYLASPEYGVNVSIDLAVNDEGDSALYFRIGEAF